MINTLTPDQITRGRAMTKALRANEKKAKGIMRDDYGNRCCLCVAYDVAQEMGAELGGLARAAGMPPLNIKRWYGWKGYNPILDGAAASDHNDGNGVTTKTHAEIADLFEIEFPQLKEGDV